MKREHKVRLLRAEPVAVTKHLRAVVVVPAVEEYERLKALDAPATALARIKKRRNKTSPRPMGTPHGIVTTVITACPQFLE